MRAKASPPLPTSGEAAEAPPPLIVGAAAAEAALEGPSTKSVVLNPDASFGCQGCGGREEEGSQA